MDDIKKDPYEKAVSLLEPQWRQVLERVPEEVWPTISEIRFRLFQPLVLTIQGRPAFLRADSTLTSCSSEAKFYPDQSTLNEIFASLCDYSVHTHAEEIRNGYISLPEGGRAGIGGHAVISGGQIQTYSPITSIDLRIPREMPGAADPLLETVRTMCSALILFGPPASGKTTILKDLIVQLSSGESPHTVAVADERGELSAVRKSAVLADFLTGAPKAAAVTQAVRSLSPEYIICDEVSTKEETQALGYALGSGVKLIMSLHANSREELLRRRIFKELKRYIEIDCLAQLAGSKSPCKVKSLYTVEDAL